MNLHSKARLAPWSRAEIVRRMLDLHQPAATVAAALGVSIRTVFKWLARFRTEGHAGLRDRSSRPKCSPKTIAALGRKHRFTRPYTPKTNGKAERFIQTSLRERAHAYAYSHSDQRSARLLLFLHNYNFHRPHHSLNLLSPISRLRLPLNNVLSLHSLQDHLRERTAVAHRRGGGGE